MHNEEAASGTRTPVPVDRVPVNDLGRAIAENREELLAALTQVLDSGWLVLGPQVAAFESELATYLAIPHVIGLASGTDALEIALRVVADADRPVVITAANCGGYTSTAARRAGLPVRYADVDPDTHVLSAETVAAALDERVGTVVVTHLYGRAADVAAIRRVCDPQGVRIVEDCAQAIGARRPEGRVGTLGDVAAFSFYPTKNLGGLGDGGAIATSREDTAAAVSELRQYGWRGKYRIVREGGRNSRLDEVQAAVLRTRLPHLDGWNARRRAIVARYAEAAVDRVRVLPAEGEGHVAHLAVTVSSVRDELVGHLTARGIRTDVHYPVPDHLQPAFATSGAEVQLPVTERLAASVLSLPLFPEMRDDEVDRVCSALGEFRA